MEIHYIIHSYGLIPEVEFFLDLQSAKEYWFNAFGDLSHDYDEKTPQESFDCGFAHWHETEMRHRIEKFELETIIRNPLIHHQIIQELILSNPNDQLLGKRIRDYYKGGYENGEIRK
jgi:hypothetical protein